MVLRKDRLFVKEETLKRVGIENMEVEAKTVSMEELIYTHAGVIKDVPENAVVAGVPAKILKVIPPVEYYLLPCGVA